MACQLGIETVPRTPTRVSGLNSTRLNSVCNGPSPRHPRPQELVHTPATCCFRFSRVCALHQTLMLTLGGQNGEAQSTADSPSVSKVADCSESSARRWSVARLASGREFDRGGSGGSRAVYVG
jgi:hypothetical protein